jgi:hypothetical protein
LSLVTEILSVALTVFPSTLTPSRLGTDGLVGVVGVGEVEGGVDDEFSVLEAGA